MSERRESGIPASSERGPRGPAAEPPRARVNVFDRLWTVPNVISIVRLACAPLILWLLFGADAFWAATILLGVLGASDWVDGWIARRYDQGSELGKVLDPTADRVLLLTAAVALLIDDRIPRWYGVLMLAREVVIAVFTLVLAVAGASRIDVLWAGKAGTFCTMFSFPAFLAASITDGVAHDAFWVIAWVFAVPGLVLSYYAAMRYVPAARRALRDGRHHNDDRAPVPRADVPRADVEGVT